MMYSQNIESPNAPDQICFWILILTAYFILKSSPLIQSLIYKKLNWKRVNWSKDMSFYAEKIYREAGRF